MPFQRSLSELLETRYLFKIYEKLMFPVKSEYVVTNSPFIILLKHDNSSCSSKNKGPTLLPNQIYTVYICAAFLQDGYLFCIFTM